MRLLKLILAGLVVALVSGAAVAATFVLKWARELPDFRQLDNLQLRATSRVYARNGQLIGVLVPEVGGERVDRTIVPLDQISPLAVAAVIASEDAQFFEHYGFDPSGLFRSLYKTVVEGERQGASTLTAQLIRSTILAKENTLARKVKEIILSVQVERYFTKSEILSGYLNVAFWGGNLSGIQAAASTYLGKSPLQLSLAEGVYLASLLPSPNDRFENYKSTRREFMKLRLARMVEKGWVSQADADRAWLEPLQPRGWKVTYDRLGNVTSARLLNKRINRVQELRTELAPHFMSEVRKFLSDPRFKDRVFGENGGGLKIITTLDPDAQRAAEEAVDLTVAGLLGRGLPDRAAQIAAVALDPYNGEVLAMVGGRKKNGKYEDFNRATMSRRSPGSSIKPLLYATALGQGENQWSTFDDRPIQVPDPGRKATPTCASGFWCPKNFDGPGAFVGGPVSMRYALDHSLNLPTVRIGQSVGLPAFRDKLARMGFPVPETIGLASSIGGLDGGVSPLTMASAYATFVNAGEWVEPHYIQRIEDAEGKVIYEAQPKVNVKVNRVWTPQTAFVALDMIRGVVNDPKPFNAQYANDARIPGREVGGKTGTSNDQTDLWFVGVTPQIAAAVWMGRDDNKPMSERVYSGVYNPPIWGHFVGEALKGKPPQDFAAPPGVAYRSLPNASDAITVAYDTRAGATAEAPPPELVQPVAVRSRPPRPSVSGPPAPYEAEVIIPLDTCRTPLVRPDETTPAGCIKSMRVLARDLALYDRSAARASLAGGGAVGP